MVEIRRFMFVTVVLDTEQLRHASLKPCRTPVLIFTGETVCSLYLEWSGSEFGYSFISNGES